MLMNNFDVFEKEKKKTIIQENEPVKLFFDNVS